MFNERRLLVITSLLSIVLLTLHLSSDALRARPDNLESGGSALVVAPLLAWFLYGILLMPQRRYGQVLMLLTALVAILMPAVHAMGPTGLFTGHWSKGNGDYLFIWTLYLLAVNGLFSLALSVRALIAPRTSLTTNH